MRIRRDSGMQRPSWLLKPKVKANRAAAETGRWPTLLHNSCRRPLLPLTTFSTATGITDLKASRHGGLHHYNHNPSPQPSLSLGVIRREAASLLTPPPVFMLIKQPITPIPYRGQCTVQRKQHVEKYTAERIFKACLCKTGVRVMCACRMSVDFCSSAVDIADAHANN